MIPVSGEKMPPAVTICGSIAVDLRCGHHPRRTPFPVLECVQAVEFPLLAGARAVMIFVMRR